MALGEVEKKLSVPKEIVVLANSIDRNFSSDFIASLRARGIKIILISASEFPAYKNYKNIVILGGHHAPEGVGKIVESLLTPFQKEYLVSFPQARKMYVKRDVWALNQTIRIFAGFEKEQTRMACLIYRDQIYGPLPGEEKVEITQPLRIFNIKVIKNAFSPSRIVVAQGDRVRLRIMGYDKIYNFHLPEYNFNLPILEPGESEEIEFSAAKAGTFKFFCDLPACMQENGERTEGEIIVLPISQ